MRSADAPIHRFHPGHIKSFAEVDEKSLKRGERAQTQQNSARIQAHSHESSTNRQWQKAWRCKHPVVYRNQSWLYRTARKICEELLDGFVDDFPELAMKRDLLYWNIREDLKDAFLGEFEARTDRQPRLIAAIEPVLSLQRTQKLLNSFEIPCKVFYSALEPRRYRELADLHEVWGQLPPGSGRGPMHLLVSGYGRHLDECEVWSWSQPSPGGGRAPLMHLWVRGCAHLAEHHTSEMKKETTGRSEVIPSSRCHQSRRVSQLTVCPMGTPMRPSVFKALQRMMRARRS